jgi:uncharacterized ferritin-like protein (DUF455 family)
MSTLAIRDKAGEALAEASVDRKVLLALQLAAFNESGQMVRSSMTLSPGFPARPLLVSPTAVPKRGFGGIHSRDYAALIHSIAHIEFNAINLALDAAWRFDNMPDQYYRDWIKVAFEEAEHFSLLNAHLASLGFAYGDFEAHAGLWEMAERTSHDVLHRMALVPRVLEARGLDATPRLLPKIRSMGDRNGVQILERILADEVGHVSIGNHWFRFICEQRGIDAQMTMRWLWRQYDAPPAFPPINEDARRAAGFDDEDFEFLATYAKEPRVSPEL